MLLKRTNFNLSFDDSISDTDIFHSDNDTWEGSFWEASDPKKIKAYLQIDYEDARGNFTSRSVKVRGFDNLLYEGIFIGYCELRHANRTFRFDRVIACTDIETGEIIEEIDEFLNDLYEKSPERSADLLVTDYIDVLKVIYFVAKADGQCRKEEKDVIAAYVKKLVKDVRLTKENIDDILNIIEAPSLQTYKLALGRVFKGGDVDPMLLYACCQEIVDTQKTVHPIEKEALDYFNKKLKRNGVQSRRYD